VNAYLGDDRDWMLRFVRRASSLAVTEGLAAWSEVKRDGIENVEVGGVCGGGLVEIPDDMPKILRAVGLE
jgi:hypothetical protein